MTKSQQRRQERLDEQLEAVLDAFRTGEVEGYVTGDLLRRKAGDEPLPMDRWSLYNRFRVLVTKSRDARGYKQWQEVGREVKKGSRAVYILAPILAKRTVCSDRACGTWAGDKDDTSCDACGAPTTRKKVLVTFKSIPVFRYEDTDGEPLPEFDYSPAELPELIEVADAWGLEVEYSADGDINGAYGAYVLTGDRIELFTHDEHTFWHELAHAGHAKVLEERGENLKGRQDPKQEAVAELTAATLARYFGAPNDGAAYDYIKGYSDSGDAHKLARAVLVDVEKVLALILETQEDVQQKAA